MHNYGIVHTSSWIDSNLVIHYRRPSSTSFRACWDSPTPPCSTNRPCRRACWLTSYRWPPRRGGEGAFVVRVVDDRSRRCRWRRMPTRETTDSTARIVVVVVSSCFVSVPGFSSRSLFVVATVYCRRKSFCWTDYRAMQRCNLIWKDKEKEKVTDSGSTTSLTWYQTGLGMEGIGSSNWKIAFFWPCRNDLLRKCFFDKNQPGRVRNFMCKKVVHFTHRGTQPKMACFYPLWEP